MPIVNCSLGSEQMKTPDWMSVPRELTCQDDCRHLYHPKEDSASHLDVLRKHVQSFPTRVEHALNIAISYSEGQIDVSSRLLIIMYVRNLQLSIYWEQDSKVP